LSFGKDDSIDCMTESFTSSTMEFGAGVVCHLRLPMCDGVGRWLARLGDAQVENRKVGLAIWIVRVGTVSDRLSWYLFSKYAAQIVEDYGSAFILNVEKYGSQSASINLKSQSGTKHVKPI